MIEEPTEPKTDDTVASYVLQQLELKHKLEELIHRGSGR
jgi:hypothetical protein